MNVELHRLSNGMRIVTERMQGLESASIGLWVAAGGRHERLEQNGVAHFLEHMAFKGTQRRTALQIAEAIEDVGGYLNAYTSRETTAYFARILAADVPLALDVISDIVLNPIFDASEMEVERGVILQEIGQALDTPDDVVFDWLQEAAYPNQAIGRSILGPSERVQSFQPADLKQFVAERYGPEQMILAAAGAVDHGAIVRSAEELFGGLAPGQGHPLEAAAFRGGERREIKDLEQVHFALAFEGPDYKDPAFYTAQIFATAFGGGMSSRLFQEVREKRGLCYTIFSQAGGYVDSGLATIYAGTSADQVRALAEITVDELKRFADDVSPAEVGRARAQMKAGLLMGLESPSNRAERLARVLEIWDRIPELQETVAAIDAVTTGDIKEFAGGLARAKMALSVYGPATQAHDLDALRARFAV
ncbi:MAG: pitrilysin family protein [Pseudomonadota bacterium]